jgi:hypothetical protein
MGRTLTFMGWVADAAQVGSALFAAVAAGASWATVTHARRTFDAAVLPDLQGEPLAMGHVGRQPRHAGLVLHNAGAGVAKSAAVLLICGDQYVTGPVAVGLLRPGDAWLIRTAIPATGTQVRMDGVIVCRDVRNRIHVVDFRGSEPLAIPFDPNAQYPTLGDLFRRVYPDVDLKSLTQVPFTAEPWAMQQ